MSVTSSPWETGKANLSSVISRKTVLYVLISSLFCAAVPAWADCTAINNANGGVDMTCEGGGVSQDSSQLGWSHNNVTTPDGTTFYGNLYGGYGVGAEVSVSDNTVNINSSTGGAVFGGYGVGNGYDSEVSVSDNTVNINSSTGSAVYGGRGTGNGAEVSVSDNTVNINSSTGDAVYGGRGTGNNSEVSVSGNVVTLNGSSSIGFDVYGGVGDSYGLDKGHEVSVSGNVVTLNGSSSVGGAVYGGNGVGYDSEVSVSVSGNVVTLNGSSTGGAVYGGYGYGNGYGSEVSVSGNVVTLNGSSTGGAVYGGYGYGGDAYGDGYGSEVSVNDNTVNINDTAKVSGSLFGGDVAYNGISVTYDAFTGNTLNFAAAPITLSDTVANFEYYHFTVDPALANKDTALITAKIITFGTNDTNMKGGAPKTSKIQVVGVKAGNVLAANDTFVLMKATDTMSGEAEYLTTKGVAQQGVALRYDMQTAKSDDGKQVTATVLGKEDNSGKAAYANPQLKALSEGHLASAMMLTRGADELAYHTVHAVQHQNSEKGFAPFITLSGGKNRYNTGSHIDAKDGLLTGGLSYQTEKLTGALLIESGWGSYNTHNAFADEADVNGDGHNRYVGAGILGHYEFDNGMFAEASFRAGQNRNTFDTKDIQDITTGKYAKYHLNSHYFGAHVGTGYRHALDEKSTVNMDAKYLWTQLKGKDVAVADDRIHFDNINSHRIRLDTGLSHQYSEAVSLQAGLGYEYEFDGKANSAVYGYNIAAPGVQGSTAILTVGSTIKPLDTQPLSVDINLNGYTGKRDGVGGGIRFSYAF